MGIYADDVLVTGSSVKKVGDFYQEIQGIELKNLGVVNKFLGKYNAETGWSLNQENDIEEMLETFGVSESAAVWVPIEFDCADVPVAVGQSSVESPVHTPRHSVCGPPSDAAFARA
uniref:AlNc14C466G11807 protein n=1 Tax=Albugo laibachii Nc14 TaxID=890382 RepID=F0X069_9STRA|nr:AlNc14C466G11807 [Albugo laibachii Nc14]|eukprot:CCA27151.1 AlNc14C466G11807 [Albugo laibachii Nc14]